MWRFGLITSQGIDRMIVLKFSSSLWVRQLGYPAHSHTVVRLFCNMDWYQVEDNWIGKIIQGLIQEQIYTQILINCQLAFLHGLLKLKKELNDNLKSPCSYQCTGAWPQLDISSCNPLGRRLISALVLTSHLKCQTIFLILLCLATYNSPRLLLFSIN